MSKRIYLSVGLLSASVIAFQLNLMQLLSILQWSHFAYMVISVALLGFGASGTLLALARRWFVRNIEAALPSLMILSGASMSLLMLVSPYVLGTFDSYLLFVDRSQVPGLLLAYFSFFVPFFFGALALGLVYIHYTEKIGSLYFSDLLGSGIGGLLMLVLFWVFYPAQLPSVIGLFPVISGIFIIPAGLRKRFILPLTAAFALPLFLILSPPVLPLSQYKSLSMAMNLPDAEVVIKRSSPYGQLEVIRSPSLRYAPGLSLTLTGTVPVRDAIFNNGNWFGPVVEWMRTDTVHFLDYTTNALPYHISRPSSLLLLDAGTGLFAAHALTRGVPSVTAVEQNRIATGLLKNELAPMIDSMYHLPAITPVSLHSRSYLLRDDSLYDLIILPTSESFGGTSGINALEEQFVLTLEALDEMWHRLSGNGMIAVTAWMDYPARNTLKLLASLVETHEANSSSPVHDHIAAVRGWGTITFVLKKSPLTDSETRCIREFSTAMFFDPALLPDISPGERAEYNQLQDDEFFMLMDIIMSATEREGFYRDYDFNIRPATDNVPYFSQYLKLERYNKLREMFGQSAVPFLEIGYLIVLMTFIQITLAAVILILLPLAVIGWKGGGKLYTVLHFSGIGLGFMFVEIILIQQFILYFGNPIYAAAAVLSGMLICSGAGSLASSRFGTERKYIVWVLALVIFFILLYIILLIPLLRLTINLPLLIKIFLSILFISPAAFFMGMPFPLGLRRLSGINTTLTPWAWGINGCLSVISTALATIIAVEAGYFWVMLLAAMSYGLTLGANLIRT
jgi:hypothetical protein